MQQMIFTHGPYKDVEKEMVSSFSFPKEDVLKDQALRDLRSYNLRRASTLGNAYQRKVKILFKTVDNEVKRIDTTIWAVSEDFISLKAGVSVPIRAILHVEF